MPGYFTMDLIFIVLIIAVIIFAIAAFLVYRGSKKLDVSEYEINSVNVPTGFDGFIIAQISDFHNTRSSAVRKKLVERLKEKKPDIIVITGDFIDYYRTDLDIALSFLREIIDIAPIYYVTGNHEERINDYSQFAEKITELGVIILDNEKVLLKRNGEIIEMLGVKDIHSYSIIEKDTCERLLKQKLNKLSDNSTNYKVLLSHRPELFDIYAESNIDLVFSGHAHGGQFRIPYLGGLFSPSQGFFPKYTCEVHNSGNTRMVISRGIGNSSFPFRINNHSELVIVKLKSK